ncbi:MAG: extracellular solute-binding protein [Bacilli bacterium]|nr:extracellular solute-binding protein [Bacilli bacterium]
MKLNKLIPATLVALMGAAGLTGCGGNNPNELIVWATAAEEAVINDVLVEYNKTVGDDEKLSVKYVAVAEGDTGTEVAKDPTASSAPDLFLCADDHIYNLQSKNIVLDITKDYGSKVKAAVTENAYLGASYNNKLYGFPVTNDNGYFLWYNKDKLGEDDVADLETLLKAAKDANAKVLFDIANGWYVPSFFFAPEVCGVESLRFKQNADGDVVYTVNWDNDNGVAAAEAVREICKTYAKNLATGNNDVIVEGFKTGSIVAAVSGTWMLEDLKGAIGDNLAACKLPTFKVGDEDAQMATFAGSKVYCINQQKSGDVNVAKRAKAVKFADYLTQKAAQLTRFTKRATIPCNNEALKDSAYTKNINIAGKALLEQFEAASAVQSLSAEGRYWDVGKAIGQALLDGKLGSSTATWKTFLKAQCDILRNPA